MLQPLQALYPMGQFDGYDSQITSFKGGEVCSLTGVLIGSDHAAADVEYGGGPGPDGYVGTVHEVRPVVTKSLVSGMRPLMLADDGISGYGTLFGSVVGGTVGQVSTGGTVLGPHTAIGSGKITVWHMPGLYSVTLDAADTTASTGLTTTNATLTVGDALYATSAGLLTPNSAAKFENVVVGRFVEFAGNGSLVNTPNYLTAALNSPTGGLPVKQTLDRAVFYFNPPAA